MPSQPQGSWGGVYGMGARLWILKLFKRCRSQSAAILVVSFWLCLVIVINFEYNGQPGNIGQKDGSNLFLRSGGFPNYFALLGFSPSDKRIETPSRFELGARLILRNELRTSVTQLQSVAKTQEAGQASNTVDDGIISGRRIQQIKLSQIRGLEALSRRYDVLRDERAGQIKNKSFVESNGGALIDSKAITVMEIRSDAQAPTKNLEDLRLNWTHEPPERAFHFLADIPQYERPQAREESKAGTANSSRDKNSLSTFFSSNRKTRSQDPEMPVVMVNYGLRAVEKSINGHFPQRIIEMHNRHSNFYGGSSPEINKHFKENDRSGANESKENADGHLSRALATENGHQYLIDSPTNSDGVTNTELLGGSRPNSNLQNPVAMQMNVPKRNKEFSPHYVIDQSEQPRRPRLTSDVKYPGQTSPLYHGQDEGNWELTRSRFNQTEEQNLTKEEKQRVSDLTTILNKNRTKSSNNDVRLYPATVTEKDHVRQIETFTDSSRNLTLAQNVEALTNNSVSHQGHRVQFQQLDLKFDGFEIYSYNVTASNALPIHRETPDTRPDGCAQLPDYAAADHLPKATVIICFHNEAPSVLLRTVYSVIDRTPSSLLENIVLVDDDSTQDDNLRYVKDELKSLKKVVYTRTSTREGLVRARLLGSRLAASEVLVFLDAHCECNVGWLEPLLFSLSESPQKVVSPYIDTIKSENFQYKLSPARLQGGFNWRLEFGWRAATGGSGLQIETQAIRTPVISGGLFAVRRDYFISMGSYDPQLNIWGGENFELSFKTWMCGGSVEIVPCSRVGHVFRASLPYTFTGDREQTVLRNLARVASVWMDDYAEIFYAAVNLPDELDIGDISERAQLRKDLHCQSFKWYLDNVFPQIERITPEILVYGQVRNKGSLMCFDVMNHESGFYLGLSGCHGGRNQTFQLTSENQLKQGDACIVPGPNKQLTLSLCSSNIKWVYKRDRLNLNHTNLCVTSVDNTLIQLLPCSDDHTSILFISSKNSMPNDLHKSSTYKKYSIDSSLQSFQQWTFDYSFNWKRRRKVNS